MSTVSLEIDGIEYIDSIVISSLTLESMVNGSVGTGSCLVRDDARSFSFIVGAQTVLRIDGTPEWRGFLMSSQRTYIFPVVDTNPAEAGLQRFWKLQFSDINVLFQKRFVFNQSDPQTGTFNFPVQTKDTTALTELYANWLDLSGDGINTTSLVENVGDINVDQVGNPFFAGDSWGTAVRTISAIPGSIDYIDPDKNYVHTDVDTPNAPFDLSDQPNGSTSFGYREMEILKDGSSLANDALEWGIGYGSNVPVFSRTIDDDSVTEHGLWQVGTLNSGIYKQATIDRVGEALVYGSPQNKRGTKDDRLSVQCVTFQPGLRVAQKVNFASEAFGFSDVIPIRRMTITFVNPTTPKYQLILSHDIDAPWLFVDQLLLDFTIPPITLPPIITVMPPPGGCTPVVCGITEDFGSGSDTSTSGLVWFDPGGRSAPSVVNDQWQITTIAGSMGLGLGEFGSSRPATSHVQSGSFDFSTDSVALAHQKTFEFGGGPWYIDQTDVLTTGVIFTVNANSSNVPPGANTIVVHREITSLSQSASDTVNFIWAADQIYHVEWYMDLLTTRVTVNGISVDCTLSTPPGAAQANEGMFFIWHNESVANPGTLPEGYFYVDNILFDDVTRCGAVQFDDFQRTVGSGWGTASAGYAWDNSSPPVSFGSSVSVEPGSGVAVLASGDGTVLSATSPTGPWAGDFVMTALVVSSNTGTTNTTDFPFISFYLGNNDVSVNAAVSTNAGRGEIDIVDGDTPLTVYTDWGAALAFWVKWERTSTVSRARVWNTTDSEPTSWTVTGVSNGTNYDTFSVDLEARTSVATTWRVHSIDFDYSGRPCYVTPGGLVCTTEDSFDRSVGSGWGTADDGHAWTTNDSSTGLGDIAFSVDGDAGVISLTPATNTALVGQASLPIASLTDGSATISVLFGQGIGDVTVATGSGSISQTVLIDLGNVSLTILNEWDLVANQVNTTFTVTGDSVAFETFDDTDVVFGTITPTFTIANGQCTVDVPHWDTFGPVDVSGSSTSMEITYTAITVSGVSPTLQEMHTTWNDFSVCRQVTPVPGPVPGSGAPPSSPSGFGCERGTRLISETYVTSLPYTRGTPIVYVNGMLQQKSTAWSESSSNDRYINFTYIVPADAVVTICYSPNGASA